VVVAVIWMSSARIRCGWCRECVACARPNAIKLTRADRQRGRTHVKNTLLSGPADRRREYIMAINTNYTDARAHTRDKYLHTYIYIYTYIIVLLYASSCLQRVYTGVYIVILYMCVYRVYADIYVAYLNVIVKILPCTPYILLYLRLFVCVLCVRACVRTHYVRQRTTIII